MPAASTSTTASPGPGGCAGGTSSSERPKPGAVLRSASTSEGLRVVAGEGGYRRLGVRVRQQVEQHRAPRVQGGTERGGDPGAVPHPNAFDAAGPRDGGVVHRGEADGFGVLAEPHLLRVLLVAE